MNEKEKKKKKKKNSTLIAETWSLWSCKLSQLPYRAMVNIPLHLDPDRDLVQRQNRMVRC